MGFDRRDFLKTALLVSAANAVRLDPAAFGQQGGGETVLVLGAGIAGMAAAQDLQNRGFRVIVLEGRLRVGGRIWTDRTLGAPVELGATWFDSSRRDPLSRLARELRLPLREVDLESIQLFDGQGDLLRGFETTRLLGLYRSTVERAQRQALDDGRAISAREAFDRAISRRGLSPFEVAVMEWALASSTRGVSREPERLSATSFGTMAVAGRVAVPEDGLDQLARSLVRGLDIRSGEVVTRVRWGDSGVQVESASGASFGAARVVIALPLGVLQEGAVAFEPGLPEPKLRAIQRLERTLVDRIALRFPSRFWPAESDFFGQLSQRPDAFPIFRDEHEATGLPILTAFVGGAFAREIEAMADEDVLERAMTVLRRLFGSSISRPMALARSRWGADPLARGSASQQAVNGSATDPSVLAEDVGGRLFFAGEATHPEAPGTLQGAYLSGLREALKIVAWAGRRRG